MSIRRKLFVGISTFILIFVIVAYSGFTLFMPDFVQKAKQNEMVQVAETLAEMDDFDEMSEAISNISTTSDISVVLTSGNNNVVLGAERQGQGHGRGNMQAEGLVKMLQPSGSGGGSFFYTTEHHALNAPYLVYVEELNADYQIYVMRPYQSIDDVVEVSNGFFMMIGIGAIVSGLLFSWVYARAFSGPILELNKIARYMSELDFSHKYSGTQGDELGELGQSVNHMSDQLNKALTELETELRHKEHLHLLQKQFLADASHELKTPLAVIMGNMEQLTDTMSAENTDEKYSKAILREIEHMDHVIQDLLTLSELESDTYILKKDFVDFSSVFDDVLYSYSELINRRKLKLIYELDDSIPIIADEKNMETVIRNIMNNAIHHSRVGATIKISSTKIERLSDDQVNVQGTSIEVYNEADQIDPIELKSLWDRFHKSAKTDDKSTVKKTGLGLSIVKSILELHEFDFGIRNADNGVVFYMTIPNNTVK